MVKSRLSPPRTATAMNSAITVVRVVNAVTVTIVRAVNSITLLRLLLKPRPLPLLQPLLRPRKPLLPLKLVARWLRAFRLKLPLLLQSKSPRLPLLPHPKLPLRSRPLSTRPRFAMVAVT